MHTIALHHHDDFDGWRAGAKAALLSGIAPENLMFVLPDDGGGLFADDQPLPPPPADAPQPTVPKDFIQLAREVACHSDPQRFALLYRLLWRLQQDRTLLQQRSDADTHRINVLAKEIRRDMHKMKAFVRFRKTGDLPDGREQFVAWFEPTHHIVRLGAPFFMRRFAGMVWSILTPKGCAHWDGEQLTFSDAVPKSEAPSEDALEDYWRSYYAAIFNPARLKTEAMQSEMPKKYWHNLPEATLIPDLIKDARAREQTMIESDPTQPQPAMMRHKEALHVGEYIDSLPAKVPLHTLDQLRTALKSCRACPLWKPATQTVPGKGPADAPLMFVGEQPGDREDLAGKPFIGPAGQVLRDVLAEIGHDPDNIYVTNAVKHFKFEMPNTVQRGKRRLHKNPSVREIDHCKWWLHQEIELVRPKVVVALGGSAVRALTGRSGTIKALRGARHRLPEFLDGSLDMVVTNHPSYILRLPNQQAATEARAALASDLRYALALTG